MNESGTVNKVFLVGEISHKPRRHKHENGTASLNFTLVTHERVSQKGIETIHTEEHSVRLPENKFEHDFKPGQWVHVEGKIKTISFTDEQEIKRYKTEIVAIRVQPLGRGGDLINQPVAYSIGDKR